MQFADIDIAYRVGRVQSGDKPRPLLIKFCKESVRNEVNSRRKNLKDSDNTANTFINADLPAKISRQRADLRSAVANAKSKNVPAKAMGDKISIDNVFYTHKNLGNLPEGLRLSNAQSDMNRNTRVISPRLSYFPDLCAYMINTFKEARRLVDERFPGTMILFGGLCGVNLNMYNGLPFYNPLQSVIDQTIDVLNYAIKADNINHGLIHPVLTRKVHRKEKKGSRNHLLLTSSSDGRGTFKRTPIHH